MTRTPVVPMLPLPTVIRKRCPKCGTELADAPFDRHEVTAPGTPSFLHTPERCLTVLVERYRAALEDIAIKAEAYEAPGYDAARVAREALGLTMSALITSHDRCRWAAEARGETGEGLRKCEQCKGNGPCLHDNRDGRYKCASCHSEPNDPFFATEHEKGSGR